MSDKDKHTETINHPMETVLDIESGTTELTRVDHSTELVEAEHYDEKDNEIESQFQEIYDAAMGAFETQSLDAETIEPKYRSRNQEVAVQMLNTALNAAKEKSTLKMHKDKMFVDKVKGTGPRTLNQNLIVADRNEILKHISGEGELEIPGNEEDEDQGNS